MTGEQYPDCYGILDKVFPMDEHSGLRITPTECFACTHKTQCLKTALHAKDGLKAKEELVDRAFESGMLGFIQRWSQKKEIHRQMKEKAQRK